MFAKQGTIAAGVGKGTFFAADPPMRTCPFGLAPSDLTIRTTLSARVCCDKLLRYLLTGTVMPKARACVRGRGRMSVRFGLQCANSSLPCSVPHPHRHASMVYRRPQRCRHGGQCDKLRKNELMKYAATLGIPTRKQGTKLWRAVKDVRLDCKLRQAFQQQRCRAHAPEPGSASSRVVLPSIQAAVVPSASGRVACDLRKSLEPCGGPFLLSPKAVLYRNLQYV